MIGATAESLAGSEKLDVDFEPDDGLILGQDLWGESNGGHI